MGEEQIHLPSVSIVFSMNNRTARNGIMPVGNYSLKFMSPSTLDNNFKTVSNVISSVYIDRTHFLGYDKFALDDVANYIMSYVCKDTVTGSKS